MTRTVEDNALLLGAIAAGGPFDASMRAGAKGLRIGVIEHFYTSDAEAEPALVQGIESAVQILVSLGARVETVQLPPLQDWTGCGRVIQQFEQYAVHEQWLKTRPQDYCELSRSKLLPGAAVTREQYAEAQEQQKLLRAGLATLMRDFDALVTLSGFNLPCRIDDAEALARTYTRHARMPFNVAGVPAIAVPTGFSQDGLPLGMQISSKAFDEAMLYRVAWAYCEETRTERRPPLDF